jgi:hypothetical protein
MINKLSPTKPIELILTFRLEWKLMLIFLINFLPNIS